MTLNSKFHFASVSDIHLFHPSTPTRHIIKSLQKAFPDLDSTGELDAIFIVGDAFDAIAYLPNPDVRLVTTWISWFLRMCAKRQIKVRILEGTPKHDRTQNTLFMDAMVNGQIDLDLKYVDTLSIEYMEDLGIHVLYVPDEWSSGNWTSSTVVTWREVQALLGEKGLEQVDFTFLHGAMDYQLPPTKEHLVHKPEHYAGITRYFVCTGHIHKPGQHGNILTNGSLERLTHGEEHDKGHWRVVVDPKGKNHKITFVVNDNAMIYKTLDVVDDDAATALATIGKAAKQYPEGSHLRVRAKRGHPVLASLAELQKEYSKYHWKFKVLDDATDEGAVEVSEIPPTQIADITPATAISLVEAKLREWNTPPELMAAAMQRLTEAVYAINHRSHGAT